MSRSKVVGLESTGHDADPAGVEIVLNGEPRRISPEKTLGEFLVELKLQLKYVAVELNERVVPRARLGDVRLQTGDRVEIVTLVGGG